MSYQVIHKEYGVFQGELWGMYFWYPTSNVPEQGFYEFTTEDDAAGFVCHNCQMGDNVSNFTITHFDVGFNLSLERLRHLCLN